MHPDPLTFPTVKRLPPLASLANLKSLITAIPPATSHQLTARRNAVRALAFDKLALTNANADTIVANFPFHNKHDRYALLHAIASSTPPPTLPGLDPDYAHEHLLDQHLLILYLLALSLICANLAPSHSDSGIDALTARHPVLDQYCSATLIPTHLVHQALACVYLDLGLLAHFDQVFPFARTQANPVLFEYIVWALAFDSGFLNTHDGSVIQCIELVVRRQNGSGDQEDFIARARNILVLCYARGELPSELAMSVCLTWNVNDAVKAAINDPTNIVPLISYISANYSPASTATCHHLALLTNNAHFLLAPKHGTKLRNDLISWCLTNALAPPDNVYAHVPDLVFHLFAHTIDYPRAVYTHYRIKQIRKHNNVPESRADVDRERRVNNGLMVKMQVTHMAELKMYMAQGVPGERAWLTQEGLEHFLYTNVANFGAGAAGLVGLKLAVGVKRAAPVAEWARATTLELDVHDKPVPMRQSSSNASDATVALPEALLLGASVDTGDLIRDAPMVSPKRPVKKARRDATAGPPRGSSQDEEGEHHGAQEGDDMDVDAGQASFVYPDQVMELQTSQSPIRSPFSPAATSPSVAPIPIRSTPSAAAFTPTPATSASTPSGLTASQVSTTASIGSSSLARDPFTPSFALPRTPSTAANHPSTTPPSVATGSILQLTPKRDGTPRAPTYLALTPVDAVKAILSRRSRRSNPVSAATSEQQQQQQAPSRPGSPGGQSPAGSSRASAPSATRLVTPFKSRLSNTATAAAAGGGAGQLPSTRQALTKDDVIMATFADNQEHQELIAPVSTTTAPGAETDAGDSEATPSLPTSDMVVDRPSTPEPAPGPPAPTSAPATPFDSESTIRPPVHLPKFDYAQFHKTHSHESPAKETQTLIETGMSAVERAKDMVRKSQAAANARAARQTAAPETPVAVRSAAGAAAAVDSSDSAAATPTVRPGRIPEVTAAAVVADTPTPEHEHTRRRVRDAGHTPAPARLAKAANARTPYDTQQTPRRTTRAATAAAAVPPSPRYELRHKPVATATAAPVSPAPPRRNTMAAAIKRAGSASASQFDATLLVSPAKTPKRAGTAVAAADATPKPAPTRGTRAGLRSGSLGMDEAPGSPSRAAPVAPVAAPSGRAATTRRAIQGGTSAAGAAGTAAGSRRATMGQQQQQQQEPSAQGVAAGVRSRRAAAVGKKK